MVSWKDYEKFLKHDGWVLIQSKSRRDKWYEKRLPDGTLWETRVSKGTGELGKNFLASILKNQAHCSKTYFNKVKNSRPKDEWERFM